MESDPQRVLSEIGGIIGTWLDIDSFLHDGRVSESAETQEHFERGHSFLSAIERETEHEALDVVVKKIRAALPTSQPNTRVEELHGRVIPLLQEVIKNLLPNDKSSGGVMAEVHSNTGSRKRQLEFFYLIMRVEHILQELSQQLWGQERAPGGGRDEEGDRQGQPENGREEHDDQQENCDSSPVRTRGPRRLSAEAGERISRALSSFFIHRLGSQRFLPARSDRPELRGDREDGWLTEYEINQKDFGKWLVVARLSQYVLHLLNHIPLGTQRKDPPEAAPSADCFDDLTDVESDRDERRESSLPVHNRCRKNPGHHGFRPMSQVSLSLLPEVLRVPRVMSEIAKFWSCTVRIKVGYTSPDRPDSLWYGNLRGTHRVRYGSGWACEFRQVPCSLENCPGISGHGEPHQVTMVTVRTAAHVVCDDSEARNTTVDFFYEDESDLSGVVQGTGTRMFFVILRDDVSYFKCVVHSPHLLSRVQSFTSFPADEIRDDHVASHDMLTSLQFKNGIAVGSGPSDNPVQASATSVDPDLVSTVDNARTTTGADVSLVTTGPETTADSPPASTGFEAGLAPPSPNIDVNPTPPSLNSDIAVTPASFNIIDNNLAQPSPNTLANLAPPSSNTPTDFTPPTTNTTTDLTPPTPNTPTDLTPPTPSTPTNLAPPTPNTPTNLAPPTPNTLTDLAPPTPNIPTNLAPPTPTIPINLAPPSPDGFTWTTMIISHPHGCAKHATVGTVVSMETAENCDTSLVDTKLLYNTKTCPGSSGGQVLVIGHARGSVFVYQTIHSCACGVLGASVNRSAITNLVPVLLIKKLTE